MKSKHTGMLNRADEMKTLVGDSWRHKAKSANPRRRNKRKEHEVLLEASTFRRLWESAIRMSAESSSTPDRKRPRASGLVLGVGALVWTINVLMTQPPNDS